MDLYIVIEANGTLAGVFTTSSRARSKREVLGREGILSDIWYTLANSHWVRRYEVEETD